MTSCQETERVYSYNPGDRYNCSATRLQYNKGDKSLRKVSCQETAGKKRWHVTHTTVGYHSTEKQLWQGTQTTA